MTKFRSFACAAMIAVAALFAFNSAQAHHGWSSYSVEMDMPATIKEVRMGNPHDRLIVTDAEGRDWNLILAPPARNRRYGYDESTFTVGDEVRIVADAHETRLEAKVHQIWRGDEMIFEYLYGRDTTSYERLGRDQPAD